MPIESAMGRHRMAEGQGGHHADTRNRHWAARRLIRLRQLADVVVELALLLADLLMDGQKRRDHNVELMILAQ